MSTTTKKRLLTFAKKMVNVGWDGGTRRDAWVMQKLSALPPGISLIDIGAGEQPYKKFCEHLKYTSQDFAQYDGRGDGSGLHTGTFNTKEINLVSDICSIPAADASFDAVLCTEVIEHVPNPIDALAEFSRLLKPGGTLILTAPFNSLTHFAPYHFCTGFSRYFYQKHLPEYGLRITEISPSGNFFDYVAQEIIRTKKMAQTYAKGRIYPWEWLAMIVNLKMLERFSKRDTGSSETLTYSYLVVATKEP
jgi:SAM-dependent methyltransferase